MKKALLFVGLISLVFSFSCNKVNYGGESGRIIHKKCDPMPNINMYPNTGAADSDTLFVDLDKDGISDLKAYFTIPLGYWNDAVRLEMSEGWSIGNSDACYYLNDGNCHWNSYFDIYVFSMNGIGIMHELEEGKNCYGWMKAYINTGSDGQQDILRFYIEEYAYCTCPNYPLKWGEK